jgi:hypothetical protein
MRNRRIGLRIIGTVTACLLFAGTALASNSNRASPTTNAALGRLTSLNRNAKGYKVTSTVGYWHLNESSGTTAVSTTASTDGSYSGSPAKDQTSLVRDGMTSVKFDGVNDAIVANSVCKHTSWPGLTLEAWVEVTRNAPSNEEHIMNFSTSSGGHAPGLFHDSPSNKLKFAVGSASTWAISNNPISSGIHYVVGTVGTDNVSKLYVDGVLQNTKGKMTERPPANCLFIIGADHDFGPIVTSFWKGRIDEPAVYDHGIGQSEVSAHYLAGQ